MGWLGSVMGLESRLVMGLGTVVVLDMGSFMGLGSILGMGTRLGLGRFMGPGLGLDRTFPSSGSRWQYTSCIRRPSGQRCRLPSGQRLRHNQ